MENQTKLGDRFQKINSIILDNDQFFIATDGSNFDSIAAASALRLMLESLGKKVVLYSPILINKENLVGLAGIDGFDNRIIGDSKKLLISFDYPLDAIEKVSSNDEAEKLSLTVEFKNSTQVIDPAKVKISSFGPEFKAGFIIGVNLGNNQITRTGSWVYFAKTEQKQAWAAVNFIDTKASFSESVASMLSRTKLSIPLPSAQNLYLGIKSDTDNFSKADSIALETAAYCLRIKEDAGVKPAKTEQTPIVQVENKEGGSLPSASQPVFTGGASTSRV